MKVALLGNSESIHCVRWANGLQSRGLDVVLVSASPGTDGIDARVDVRILDLRTPLAYWFAAGQVRRILAQTAPDLVNAHYATGYGLLAKRAGFKPLLLSVWGSDVYDFPRKSALHAAVLRANLSAATALASTSHCMARETSRTYAHPSVFVTPFGVDTDAFSPAPEEKTSGRIVVGTVKTLASKYGIDTLIEAFSQAWKALGNPDWLHLEIGGGGSDFESLNRLVVALGIVDQVRFHGQVAHSEVPGLIHRMDIFVALSRLDSESFGVAAVEAAACGKPVLVSDAQGLAEVTLDGVTGLVVPKNDAAAASAALLRLIGDEGLRRRMGDAGRRHVLEHYSWDKSLDLMIEAYKKTLALSGHNP